MNLVFSIQYTFIGTILVLILLITGCNEKQAHEMINQTDVQLLGRFIKLPLKPERVKFDVRTLGVEGGIGPTDTEVFAVLEYSSSNFDKVIKLIKASAPTWESGDYELQPSNWFNVSELPDNVVSENTMTIKATALQSAEPFFSSPYLNGVVIPLKKLNTILIVLFTS